MSFAAMSPRSEQLLAGYGHEGGYCARLQWNVSGPVWWGSYGWELRPARGW